MRRTHQLRFWHTVSAKDVSDPWSQHDESIDILEKSPQRRVPAAHETRHAKRRQCAAVPVGSFEQARCSRRRRGEQSAQGDTHPQSVKSARRAPRDVESSIALALSEFEQRPPLASRRGRVIGEDNRYPAALALAGDQGRAGRRKRVLVDEIRRLLVENSSYRRSTLGTAFVHLGEPGLPPGKSTNP